MPVTIKDIAKAAGVSHTTVSRALNGSSAVASATAQRILETAERLGYVPNSVARSLKTKRSNLLGVMITRFDDPFFAEVLHGIEDRLSERDYSFIVAASNKDPHLETEIVQRMSERRVEGVIVCSTQVGEAHRDRLNAFGVPSVLVNNQDLEDLPFAVSHDDVDGARRLTRHLLELGHTRLGYIGNAAAMRTTLDRLQGVRMELAAHGLTLDAELQVDGVEGNEAAGMTAARRLLQRPFPPSALVCFNDRMALGALGACRAAGLDIPRDISITGFDDIPAAPYSTPALTTWRQPKYQIGQQAVDMMFQLLQGRLQTTQPSATRSLKGALQVRASTGPHNPGTQP